MISFYHIVENGVYLNGYMAVRNRDIARARRPARKFPERLLTLRNEGPVIPSGIDLDRTRDLLRTATKQFRIVATHLEYDERQVCYIGTACRFRDSTFRIHELSPDTEWLPKKFRYTYKSISRVDFDDEYNRALLEVADASSSDKKGSSRRDDPRRRPGIHTPGP